MAMRGRSRRNAFGRMREYAIHGEGVSPRVHRIEGVVGIIVVGGLSQGGDPQVVVQALEALLKG